MGRFAVVAQGFPVVRGEDDEGRLLVAREMTLQDRPQIGIHGRDLAEIGIRRKPGRKRLGGLVRCMGIIKMEPEEAPLTRMLAPPVASQRHHFVTATLGRHQLRGS